MLLWVVKRSADISLVSFWQTRVAGCELIRVITIRHRAWLACRSPPGLSRWRVTFPDDAGIGATPHRCAHAASERSRAVRPATAVVPAPGPGRQIVSQD